MSPLLLLANLILSACLTGLIWFVQIVHYPIFRKVPASHFGAYHAAHTLTTGRVVALPMLIELGIGGWLALQPVPATLRWIHYGAYACVILVWAVTFGVAVPLHDRMTAAGYGEATINSLVASNWARTVGWTVRMVLLAYLVYQYLGVKR
jgi:hypothetical protein